MSDTEKLFIIEKELRLYTDLLAKASDIILESEVSKYPMFVVHKEEDIEIGIPVIDKFKTNANWSIKASTLEEFAAKRLIAKSKIDTFRKTYKNPKDFLCLFVLSSLGAQFIFLPR